MNDYIPIYFPTAKRMGKFIETEWAFYRLDDAFMVATACLTAKN